MHTNITSLSSKLFFTLSFLLFLLSITGCPPKEVQKEVPKEQPPVEKPSEFKKTGTPDTYFRAASIDLKSFPRKIESKDIERFASVMKKEKIEILAVQTIVRYPDLKDRTDVFEEIAKKMDMYETFGETFALSGRQTGNALFAAYPIRSSQTIPYKNLKSMNFESALTGIVDVGARQVAAISTRIPDKATDAEIASCLSTITKFTRSDENGPLALFSNIIKPGKMENLAGLSEPLGYVATSWKKTTVTELFPLWYSSGDLQVMKSNVVETELGPALVVEFKLAGKPAQ